MFAIFGCFGTALANQPPVIDDFSASATTVAPGKTVTLTVQASDPDCLSTCTSGCGLTINSSLTLWSATEGVFDPIDNGVSASPYTATAVWTAPATEDTFTIEVSVSDSGTWMCGDRQTTTATILVTVTSSTNRAPTVDDVTADSTQLFPDETTALHCLATDLDGDPLTYAWASDLGTVTPGVGETAEFSSDGPGVATISCTATDPSGAPGIGSVVVSVSDVAATRAVRAGMAGPQRLAVDSTGTLYTVDRSAGGISAVRLENDRFMYRLPAPDATAVAADWNDNLLTGTKHGVDLLSRDGSLIRQLAAGRGEISDVAVDRVRRHHVALERQTGRVMVFDELGTPVVEFGATGDGPDQVRSPSGVAVLSDGRIVVADTGHGMLKIFDQDGSFNSSIGSPGDGAGEFVELDDVAVDSRDVIWASDSFQDWVQTFDADGTLREIIGTYGGEIGQFKTAAGVALAEDFNAVVVASVNSSSVQVFDLGPPEATVWPQADPSLTTPGLTFPDQAVGTTGSALGVGVSNSGTGTLGISNLQVSGDFVVTRSCSAVLPGGTCTVEVAFRPSSPGKHTGELLLFTSAAESPLRVSLTGFGYIPAGLDVSPSQIDFSSQAVGLVSESRSVVLTNTGTAELSLGQIAVSGPFSMENFCGSSLAGSSSCIVRVVFAPTVPGPASGALTIESDAPGSPHQTDLFGTGEILELSPQPSNLDFGLVAEGTRTAAETVHVVNSGTAAVAIGEVTLTGLHPFDFEIVTDQCSGTTVGEGQGCWLQISFVPQAPGNRSAEVDIPIAEGLHFTVSLEAAPIVLFQDGFETGDTTLWSLTIPEVTFKVSPMTVEFGEVVYGEDTGSRRVSVSNLGTEALWLGRLSIVGDGAPGFAFDDDFCSDTLLEAGESCTFTVTMWTLDEGAFKAFVDIPTTLGEDDRPDLVHIEGAVWLP